MAFGVHLLASMVVASRLQWLRQQAAQGVAMVIHIGLAKDTSICKVRCVLYPLRPPLQPVCKHVLTATLDTTSAVPAVSELCITIDRGHAHSSGASSEAAFWIRCPPGGIGNSGDTMGSDDSNEEDDDDHKGHWGPEWKQMNRQIGSMVGW